MDDLVMRPIGHVICTRAVPEDDDWDSETASVTLIDGFTDEALEGLDDFSHAIVVYALDRAAWDPARQSRHPRGNTSWPRVGIFAQRAKDRPNRLGVSVARVVAVEGAVVHVAGLDAVDGTPVVDLKPWMDGFGPRGAVTEPAWVADLMRGYWA